MKPAKCSKSTRVYIFGLLLLHSGLASAISTNQIDTFSDGTLQSWMMGSPVATDSLMTIVNDGGPTGVGDNYLEVSSDSTLTTAGKRLTFFNQDQWTGDYLGTGVIAISMDLKNFSSSETLTLRLGINGGVSVIDGGLFATSDSVTLASGSNWTHVVFSFDPLDLVSVSGASGTTGNNVLATLGNVTELRLLNSAVPDWNGLPVTATLGIDNIKVVPLPPALTLFVSGLITLLSNKRRRINQLQRSTNYRESPYLMLASAWLLLAVLH